MAETKNGIKYPDNYNSVADIPKDLKEMAESIDPLIENKVEKENGKGLSTNDFTNAYKEKLDGLNNYNDTKIKQDIKDIKDEQKTQNEDISTLKAQKKALEKEVQNLKEDNRLNTLTEDNEGELINITNTTGARFNSLEICGNDKQETTDISPSFDEPSPIKCVGDNKNVFDDSYYKGFIVTQQNYNALEKIDLKLENNKYYVAKIYFDDGTSVAVNNSNFMLYAYKADGTQSANIPNGIAKTYANATELVKAKIVANATGLSAYANKVIKGIKIEEVADEDGQPSPYSNYGQGCIELNITNKNILDVSKNSTVTKAGMTVSTDKDGILTLNGTTTSAIYIGLNKNNFIMQAGNLFERSMFRKGNYNFSVDNLSSTQTLNASAYIRKNYNSGEIIYLESVFSAKHRDKNFILEEDKEAIVYLWIASGITLNNAKLKFQLELEQEATDIVANEEQNYVIPVQQRMFKQDKFIKINGVWKEMHTMGTVYSKDVSNIVVSGSAVSGVDGFYRYNVSLGVSNRKGGSYIRILSNYFKYGDSRWNNKEGICGWENGQSFSLGTYNKNYDTADKLKEFLTENNVEFDYELAKPIYLDCTPEQIEVLDKIEQEAHTYSEVTNIYTEDEVGAIIKSNTAVDLKSVINNVVEAQLEQIGG